MSKITSHWSKENGYKYTEISSPRKHNRFVVYFQFIVENDLKAWQRVETSFLLRRSSS